ncbi:3-hydroxybutyryl-CoA dehydrogenase [Xanthomonas campestris pv. campestris]|uniref:3-hydroxyacyl-CoA dehydrogenase family protein n=1 Tax=Xanthomonas campestris TaxID=339 RepID=UPI001E44491A|nr:3-hydroxyacyl-CoA dehydrogenase NAD-binding domain-containing protein [Xanthomonas campestris]MCD0254763.1 3-hydroxybutyryl-CoA dehydrogenase [Xanthomonas campestris pv. campestris]MEB1300199.1 3-hydroxyacyl-CoA dehydrogenase NAD-binding domain-containing protein [Xanthomonas campestris pv. campestris]MEB1308993.1 3-hydroxyacyl-CoA dehydrogenase NAD-binding domain-containing protein [Xanthomonas campestris pv. campestris]MEB1334076.1 3-hydroxyacyl-CoA dehydrogenase NAD-binding domain-contain
MDEASLKTIGVVGAGVMGVGVAQCAARAGLDVVVLDLDDAILKRSRTEIRNQLRFQAMMGLGVAAADIARIMARMRFETEVDALADAGFVVENIVEDWARKRVVYEALDRVCGPQCAFAANTSAISITRIGSATARPDRVMGMHFMNPVPMKDTVEVIRGFHTSQATLDLGIGFLRRMRMDAVVVNDSPGFVSNRVLMLTINEAIALVHEDVSSAADVDRIFESCFGHRMGPLATADLIGLDTILLSLEVLQESFGDPKFRPSVLLKKMVDAGLHGRKSGRGFFDYSTGADAPARH